MTKQNPEMDKDKIKAVLAERDLKQSQRMHTIAMGTITAIVFVAGRIAKTGVM